MSSPSQYVSHRVGHRVGQTLGRSDGGPAQLLVFTGADAVFSRNNGSGAGGGATSQSGAATLVDWTTDQLRTETLGGVPLYLFEREVRNLIAGSDTASGWAVSGATVTEDSTDVTDPFGTTLATKVAFPGTASHNIGQTITDALVPNSSPLVTSIYIRGAVGSESLRFGIRRRDGTTDLPAMVPTNGWTRVTYEGSALSGASAVIFYLFNGAVAGARTCYVTRAQCEIGTYPTSPRFTTASRETRYADSLMFPSAGVPADLRDGAWSITARLDWKNADLADGTKRVICSTDSSNWIGFEKDTGSLYLRCYVGGVLKFGTGAITVARKTDYEIVCDLAAAVMTFDGVAGSAGTTTALPGGVALRWGGTAGGTNELDGATSEPVAV